MGYRRVEKHFNVPKAAFERHTKSTEEIAHVNFSRPILPEHIKVELVKYCIEMDIRRKDVNRIAFQLVIRDDIQHSFSVQIKSAGKRTVAGV